MSLKNGSFCWNELCTTDFASAQKFYSGLLDWTVKDVSPPESSGAEWSYHFFEIPSGPIGGFFEKKEVPPCWLSYVQVESADATSTKAKELGATLIQEPFDVGQMGRMSVITDPTGATFAIWQPKDKAGQPSIGNEPSRICWNELITKDVDRAAQFYQSLFSWELKGSTGESGDLYTEISNDGQPMGGLFAPPKEMGEVPPHWGIYVSVKDCQATADKAKASGAQIIVPPKDIPQTGKFSAILDPLGAAFNVIQLDPKYLN